MWSGWYVVRDFLHFWIFIMPFNVVQWGFYPYDIYSSSFQIVLIDTWQTKINTFESDDN